jgi:hypothetical protein
LTIKGEKAMSSNGAICGGVVKRSEFIKDPMAYMMAYYMDDEKFDEYVRAKDAQDEKTAHKLFEEFAYSAI